MPKTILISGAANGLGAAFLRAYEDDDANIIALDRDAVDCSDRKNIRALQVDISSQESICSLAKEVSDISIELVVHSAGIRGLVPDMEEKRPESVAACETLDVVDHATMMRTFEINAAGTFMLLRALLPNLRAAGGKVIVMASRMGSVGNNQKPNKDAGSAYAYRASKAALNTIVRSFAADVPEVTFILVHPGRVETKLVRCKEEGAISAEESVNGLLPLIQRWDKGDSGKYYDRFGDPIQW
jgi:NAD(P)-dependent dehydrogenase (short-subunit alcohol dehydrogenase family)